MLLVVLLGAVLAACGGDDAAPGTPAAAGMSQPSPAVTPATPAVPASPTSPPSSTATPAPPATVEEVYARAGKSLRQLGGIYHATIEVVHEAGVYSYAATIERWVDSARNVVRETTTYADGTTYVSVIAGGATYTGQPGGAAGTAGAITAPTCFGAPEAVSAVLGCPGPTEVSTTTLEQGTHDGLPALVLVTTGEWSGSDSTTTFTSRLYLDAATLLPVAREMEGEVDYGTVAPLAQRATYRHELVAPESLPAGLFDPASIGFVRPDPEAPLDDPRLGIAVYWLGARFDPGGGLPPLVLGNAVPAEPDGPGYVLTLEYRLEAEPFGPAVVMIRVWPGGDWQDYAAYWETYQPCHQREEISLDDGRAVLYSGYSDETLFQLAPAGTPAGGACPDPTYDRFGAVAELGGTALIVDAPGVAYPRGFEASPYDTRAGIEAVVRGLKPRAPRPFRPTPTPLPTPVPTTPPTPAPGAAVTPGDLLGLLDTALRRPGLVDHVTVTQVIVRDGQVEPWWSAEVWVDGNRNAGRAEYRHDPRAVRSGVAEITSIFDGQLAYFTIPGKGPGPPEAPYCYGIPGPSPAVFLLCAPVYGPMHELLVEPGTSLWDGDHKALAIRVEQDVQFEGQAAVALVYELDPSLVKQPAVLRLYLDRATFLPLAWVNESIDGGALLRRYTHEFVPAGSLPDGFFDPATLE
jgi:hypothetical protein